MKSDSQPYKAFVSSTYIDLKDHRAHVINSLRNAGFFVDPMENWSADNDEPKKFSQKRLNDCDLCILLVAFRRGHVPDGETRSITQLEYDAAMNQGVEILPFLLDESEPWPRKFDERKFDESGKEDLGTEIAQWRKHLGEKHGRTVFTLPPGSIDISAALWRWRDKKQAGRSESEKIQRIDWPEGKSPYPGLFSFDLDYAPLFFGRDRDVDAVLGKMSQAAGRCLIISGASGSGKSSLVAAGIRRAVNDGCLLGGNKMVWLRIQPGQGHTPWESLTWPLIDTFPRMATKPAELATELATNPQTLRRLLDTHLPTGSELLLFVDQLEELFTSGFQDQEVTQFLDMLVTTSRATNSRLRVIGTVRSEFLGRVQESEVVCEALNGGGSYFLSLISPSALHEMIEKPAQATGYDFEEDLVNELVQDAGQEPGRLPLVAYVMNQLFLQLKDRARLFTRDAYRAIGRVGGAIGTQADRVLQSVDRNVDAAFGRVFAELVHIERSRPPTRNRASLSRFTHDTDALTVIQVLAGPECRVLVTGSEQQGATVEVAHEQLFSAWPKLKEWIERSEGDLRLIDFEEECATRWQETGGHTRDLWRREQAEAVQMALTRFSKTPSARLNARLKPQWMLLEKLKDASLSHRDRLLIGQKLAEFGDPRAGVGLGTDGLPDILWVEIPGGQGTVKDSMQEFMVEPFRIAKYLVTNAQFEAFLKAKDGSRNKTWWEAAKRRHEVGQPSIAQPSWLEANSPRETVSWYEAVAFCCWLSAKTRTSIRLPTEGEWQQAATGGDPQCEYPWRGEWDRSRCNSWESRLSRTTAVGMYPRGATQQGILDMVGNVDEWCLNTYRDQDKGTTTDGEQVIRGGFWTNAPVFLHAADRYWLRASSRYSSVGFRLVQEIA